MIIFEYISYIPSLIIAGIVLAIISFIMQLVLRIRESKLDKKGEKSQQLLLRIAMGLTIAAAILFGIGAFFWQEKIDIMSLIFFKADLLVFFQLPALNWIWDILGVSFIILALVFLAVIEIFKQYSEQ